MTCHFFRMLLLLLLLPFHVLSCWIDEKRNRITIHTHILPDWTAFKTIIKSKSIHRIELSAFCNQIWHNIRLNPVTIKTMNKNSELITQINSHFTITTIHFILIQANSNSWISVKSTKIAEKSFMRRRDSLDFFFFFFFFWSVVSFIEITYIFVLTFYYQEFSQKSFESETVRANVESMK